MSAVEFAFDEDPELGVFVSRQVRDGARVRRVDHDHDGDWVFTTGQEPLDSDGEPFVEDILLIHLQHVVDEHPEVLACADLPTGFGADFDGERWQVSELVPEDQDDDDEDGNVLAKFIADRATGQPDLEDPSEDEDR